MVISNHAIKRFKHHSHCKGNNIQIANKLQNMLNKSKPIKVSQKFHKKAIFKHGLNRIPKYRYCSGWILVIIKDELKTVYFSKLGGKFKWQWK
jgi:hypothetical protein